MRTNHPGSAAVNFTASNLTLLGFALVIGHLCGKRVCVAKTKFACDCPKNDHERDSRSQCDNITALRPAAEGATPAHP